jgi:hypothetical protein
MNTNACFPIPVAEDDFPLINYTDVCSSVRVITPCYDRLNHDRIFSSDILVTSRPPSRGAGSDLLWSVS